MHETEKEIPKEVNNNVDLSVDKNITDGTLSVDGETDDDGRSDNAETVDDGMTESVDGETDDDGMTDDDEEELKEEVVRVETPDENARLLKVINQMMMIIGYKRNLKIKTMRYYLVIMTKVYLKQLNRHLTMMAVQNK